jgi:polar amino acid transport system substrate-binding protein
MGFATVRRSPTTAASADHATDPVPPSRRLLLTGLVLAVSSCGLPRDSAGSIDRIRGGVLRVGVATRPPWTVVSAQGVSGVEVDLLSDFARALGARVEWVPGSEAELLEALERRELDVVAAGLTDATPWKGRVALTLPYYTDSVVVGTAKNASPLGDIDGMRIAVEAGDPIAATLREKHATPMPVGSLDSASGPIAAPSWRIEQLARVQSGAMLGQSKHMLATPSGENALLVALERFLHTREASIGAALRSARS